VLRKLFKFRQQLQHSVSRCSCYDVIVVVLVNVNTLLTFFCYFCCINPTGIMPNFFILYKKYFCRKPFYFVLFVVRDYNRLTVEQSNNCVNFHRVVLMEDVNCRSSSALSAVCADSVRRNAELGDRCGTYPKSRPPSCTQCTNLPHGQSIITIASVVCCSCCTRSVHSNFVSCISFSCPISLHTELSVIEAMLLQCPTSFFSWILTVTRCCTHTLMLILTSLL